jgi:hypothetical protein
MFNRLPGAILSLGHTHQWRKGRQGNDFGNPRRADPFGHLQQGHRPQNDANLLNTAAQQLLQFLLVFLGDFDTQGGTSHTLSMPQNISDWNCIIRTFSGGQ